MLKIEEDDLQSCELPEICRSLKQGIFTRIPEWDPPNCHAVARVRQLPSDYARLGLDSIGAGIDGHTMSDFVLSPGITPLITEVAILGFVLSYGVASAIHFRNWRISPSLMVLAIDTLAIGTFKIYTDYFDFWDLLLSLVIMTESLAVLGFRLKGPLNRSLSSIGAAIGIIGVLFSVDKIVFDFYDPFDLLLACLGAVCAAAIFQSMRPSRTNAPKPSSDDLRMLS